MRKRLALAVRKKTTIITLVIEAKAVIHLIKDKHESQIRASISFINECMESVIYIDI